MADNDPTPPTASADPRRELRTPLVITKVCLDLDHQVFFGYSTNISCSGMFITTVNPRPVGSQFVIEMTLPPPLNLNVRCRCETVWQRRYSATRTYQPGMGLRFIDLPDEARSALQAWINEQIRAQAQQKQSCEK